MYIEYVANINGVGVLGFTLLMFPAPAGHLTTVKFLLQKGANIKKQNEKNDMALILAAKRGHFEIVNEIFQFNADISIRGFHNTTVLQIVS